MPNHDDLRVLARAGARVLTSEEMAQVTGGESNVGRPTSTFSRDATGRPVDVTQD